MEGYRGQGAVEGYKGQGAVVGPPEEQTAEGPGGWGELVDPDVGLV